VSTEKDIDTRKLEQDGFDITYIVEIKLLRKIWTEYMHWLLETIAAKPFRVAAEHLEYETKIRDDPIELLRFVSMLMHDKVWAH